MSTQTALSAIRSLRVDLNAQQHIQAMGNINCLQPLIQLAAEHGFRITEDELQKAFALEWQMRWIKYNAAPSNSS